MKGMVTSVAKYGTEEECLAYMRRHPELKKQGYKVIKPFSSWIVAKCSDKKNS